MAVETAYKHIVINEADIPMIVGTKTKVIEIILDSQAYGWSPEELHFQHPHLSIGQIYSALAYYWDHKAELDEDIERRLKLVDQIRQSMKPSSLEARLKSKGLL